MAGIGLQWIEGLAEEDLANARAGHDMGLRALDRRAPTLWSESYVAVQRGTASYAFGRTFQVRRGIRRFRHKSRLVASATLQRPELNLAGSSANMEKKVIHTDKAPAAIGPYSQAIEQGHWIFTSGQVGLEPLSGNLVAGGFEAQVKQAFANLEAVLTAAGAKTSDIIKLTLFLTDLAEFATVNRIMTEIFSEPYPARSTVGVASLPRGALFEVEAVASL